jgi:hypothetical protein
MRKIINSKVYDTETAECLMSRVWHTHHPNLSGGPPTCDHTRCIYRTKKGVLFAYRSDDTGYGRNRDGASGAFYHHEAEIIPLADDAAAVTWAEENDFDAEDVEGVFAVEEA